MVLNVIAGVDVGMGICVSVSGLMGALIGNCTFLVKLLARGNSRTDIGSCKYHGRTAVW